MKEKAMILEFNDGSVVNYTFENPVQFTKPFYESAYVLATEMIYEAISNIAKYDKLGTYTFKNLCKINNQVIYHETDIVDTFVNLPIFNELAAECVINHFATAQENTELQTTGETTNSEFDLG